MKKVLSLVLVLCMVLGMSVSAFAADATVNSYEEFKNAVESTDVDKIILAEDIMITDDTKLTISKAVNIDLNNHTLTLHTKENDTCLIIKGETAFSNGNIVLSTEASSCGTGNGTFSVYAQLSFSKVNLSSTEFAAYSVFFMKNNDASLAFAQCDISLKNNKYSGSIMYTNGTDNSATFTETNIVAENLGPIFVYGDIEMTNESSITVSNSGNVFNRSDVAIDNSAVDLSDCHGRGFTLDGNTVTITNSTVTIDNMSEGGVMFKSTGDTFSADDTSVVNISNCTTENGDNASFVDDTDKSAINPSSGTYNENTIQLPSNTIINDDGSVETPAPVVEPEEPFVPVVKEETYKTTIIGSQNGSVKADSKKVTRGEKVTLTVTPDKGYELAALLVIDEDGNERKVTENEDGIFSFRMPEGGVTVEAEFVKIGAVETAPSTEKENPSTGAADFVGAAAALAVVSVMGMAALSLKK